MKGMHTKAGFHFIIFFLMMFSVMIALFSSSHGFNFTWVLPLVIISCLTFSNVGCSVIIEEGDLVLYKRFYTKRIPLEEIRYTRTFTWRGVYYLEIIYQDTYVMFNTRVYIEDEMNELEKDLKKKNPNIQEHPKDRAKEYEKNEWIYLALLVAVWLVIQILKL